MAPPAVKLVMLILGLFILIALIGWFFQKSIHHFVQALVAHRQANQAGTQQDIEAAARL
ncbi:hypothetical protein THARTR1_09067 [Trichoderma harzianum]|uniref:Uncharacterized protein n=1 Tax=Trichoderma harzianum TaxID=5544 RepID=A0A2K0TXM1_TRIHA|nr:hypothetical protein THARTR1_09067 [Trichoderma harzianum]